MDPQGLIQFKLFRESTKFIDNQYVKVRITFILIQILIFFKFV